MLKYLKAYSAILTNRRGSPTVEYVILIGVGAAVASLLAVALSKDHNAGIIDVIAKKISAIIDQATTPTPSGGNDQVENTKNIWGW